MDRAAPLLLLLALPGAPVAPPDAAAGASESAERTALVEPETPALQLWQLAGGGDRGARGPRPRPRLA